MGDHTSVVASHIQRIGCQPEKTTLHGGQSRLWSAEQGKKKRKKKVWERPPLPPRAARSEKKKKEEKKITRRIHISRRYASRRYAGGLGPSRIRKRIPTTRHIPQHRIAKCCCLEKRINKTWNIEFCPQPHDNATFFCKRCYSYIRSDLLQPLTKYLRVGTRKNERFVQLPLQISTYSGMYYLVRHQKAYSRMTDKE